MRNVFALICCGLSGDATCFVITTERLPSAGQHICNCVTLYVASFCTVFESDAVMLAHKGVSVSKTGFSKAASEKRLRKVNIVIVWRFVILFSLSTRICLRASMFKNT